MRTNSQKVRIIPLPNPKKNTKTYQKKTHKVRITMSQFQIVSEDTIEEAIKNFHVTKIKFALSPNQIDEILSLALENNYKHYLIIRLMIETGLRVSELCNLRIENMNFIECELEVKNYAADRYCSQYKTKTERAKRYIPLTKEFAQELKRYLAKRERGYLFLSQKTGQGLDKKSVITSINSYAKKAVSIHKTIGAHSLRRTFASTLANKNIPIGKISKVLGHKDIKTTLLYLYEIEDRNFDDIRKIYSKNQK